MNLTATRNAKWLLRRSAAPTVQVDAPVGVDAAAMSSMRIQDPRHTLAAAIMTPTPAPPAWLDEVIDLGRKIAGELDDCIDQRDVASLLVEAGFDGTVERLRELIIDGLVWDVAERGAAQVQDEANAGLYELPQMFGKRSLKDAASACSAVLQQLAVVQIAMIAGQEVDSPQLAVQSSFATTRNLVFQLDTPDVVAQGMMGSVGVDAAILLMGACLWDKRTVAFKRRKWVLNATTEMCQDVLRWLSLSEDHMTAQLVPEAYRVDPREVLADYHHKLRFITKLRDMPVEGGEVAH